MTLEYVIIVPAVLTMMFLCVQVAIYSFARSVALTAAEEGANAQRAYGSSAGAGQAKAEDVIKRQGDTLSNWTVVVTTVGGEVHVTVTGYTLSVVPGFDGYKVTQTASGPVERFNR